jgi:hypothetical protein
VPAEISAIALQDAVARIAEEDRLKVVDEILGRLKPGDRTALLAAMYALRAGTPGNADPDTDIVRAVDAATKANDAAAWCMVLGDLPRGSANEAKRRKRMDGDAFLVAYTTLDNQLRGSVRHNPARAHFEDAFASLTAEALKRYSSETSLENSARLSGILELSRASTALVGRTIRPGNDDILRQAFVHASDWIGRIAHAIRRERGTLVVIVARVPSGTAILTISGGDGRVETYDLGAECEAATADLTAAMRGFFEKSGGADFEALGARAYALLPLGVRKLLEKKSCVLLVPDLAAADAATPYELLRGPRGFLGISHVVARMPTLRDVAAALEPPVLSPHVDRRALCIAAPDTIPNRRLRLANGEVATVRKALQRKRWAVPGIESSQAGTATVLDGFELASLVHLAAHGVASGGTHALLLPGGQRVSIDDIVASKIVYGSAVYLSACSIGASEYLGGGVSRGFASALLAKGAPCVVASQWPLEDASAATFAEAFYRLAETSDVGEALRAAREHVSTGVSPALWGSIVLLGDPWHRLGESAARSADATVQLWNARLAPRGTRRGGDALSRARAALQKKPGDHRLGGAVAFATAEAQSLGTPERSRSLDWLSAMAELARDLNDPPVEAFYHELLGDTHVEAGREAEARDAYNQSVALFEWAARANELFRGARDVVLEKLQRMDAPEDVPTIKLSSGLTINDQSDPAVRAVLRLTRVVDQDEVRRKGAAQLRLPEQSIADLCWNAIVLGERNRYSDQLSCAAFAQMLISRAVDAKWLTPKQQSTATNVAAGLLYNLWTTQRMTHLGLSLARAQADTLTFALSNKAVRDVHAPQKIATLSSAVLTPPDRTDGSRFARARANLESGTAVPGAVAANPPAALREAVERFVGKAPLNSVSRSGRAAWGAGLLLERARTALLNGRQEIGDQLLREFTTLQGRAESNLMPVKMEGFAAARAEQLDALVEWRLGIPDRKHKGKRAAATTKAPKLLDRAKHQRPRSASPPHADRG